MKEQNYYVKIDSDYRIFHSLYEAQNYNDLLDGDGIFVDAAENKRELIIADSVNKYMSKKSKHIEVRNYE